MGQDAAVRADTAPTGEPDRAGTIELAADGPHHVARLAGEVDAAVVQEFSRRSAPGDADALVTAVDAAEVDFLDSSGLSLMLRWATRARSSGLTTQLRSASPAVVDLLRLSGTAALFADGPDLPAARSSGA